MSFAIMRPMKKAVPKRNRRRTFFKEWRKYRGLTLEEAAERSGMTAGNISAMERGAQGYTQDGLEALALAYSTEPGLLLNADPAKDDAILSIWERAKPAERTMIVEVSRTIVKTGT
jgi:transcriptional regulator with XRE-family HTH domain